MGGGHRVPSLVSGELLLISPAQASEHPSAWVCSAAAMAMDFCLPQGLCSATWSPPLPPIVPGVPWHPPSCPHAIRCSGLCSQACELPIPVIYAPILSRQSREREPKPPPPPLLAPAPGTHMAPCPPWLLGLAQQCGIAPLLASPRTRCGWETAAPSSKGSLLHSSLQRTRLHRVGAAWPDPAPREYSHWPSCRHPPETMGTKRSSPRSRCLMLISSAGNSSWRRPGLILHRASRRF